jgi:low affinity Fe/Cu permease
VTKKHGFASMAQNTAKLAGSSSAFVAICLITFVWLVTGPIFHWSDTWQLVINTVTNIGQHADGLRRSEHPKQGKLRAPT